MPPPSTYPRGLDGLATSADCRLIGDTLILHRLNGVIINERPGVRGCPGHRWTQVGLTSAHEYCRDCGEVREARAGTEPRGVAAKADDPNVMEGEFREDG